MNGYNESEFTEKFLTYIETLDFGDLSKDDRNLLMSTALTYNNVSQSAQQFICSWLAKWEKTTKLREDEQRISALRSQIHNSPVMQAMVQLDKYPGAKRRI